MDGGRAEFPAHFLLLVRYHAEDFDIDHDHDTQGNVERGHGGVDLIPVHREEGPDNKEKMKSQDEGFWGKVFFLEFFWSGGVV